VKRTKLAYDRHSTIVHGWWMEKKMKVVPGMEVRIVHESRK